MKAVKMNKLNIVYKGVCYHADMRQIETNSLNLDEKLTCELCGRRVYVVSELIRYGKSEDKHTMVLLCKTCNCAFMYNHFVKLDEVTE